MFLSSRQEKGLKVCCSCRLIASTWVPLASAANIVYCDTYEGTGTLVLSVCLRLHEWGKEGGDGQVLTASLSPQIGSDRNDTAGPQVADGICIQVSSLRPLSDHHTDTF